jgi:tetratricopeptide (TPR) repeat protein
VREAEIRERAFAMPLTSPAYPPGPYRFVHREFLNITYRTLATLGGRERGTARLEEAVAAYRDALKEQTRERVPVQWAMTQHSLGNALRTLGERESGTVRLEEAVAAYRDALKERTRELVPLAWAATLNNLGNALQTLGARESGTAHLEEAVAAYRDALKERTRERVPLASAILTRSANDRAPIFFMTLPR